MNTWIRRSASVVIISAGMVAAGAATAQAASPADNNNWDFSTNAYSSAASGNYYSNAVTQSGSLANVNVSPNIQISGAYSSAAAAPVGNSNWISYFAH